MTSVYYVVRSGFNAANQTAMGRRKSPRNQFESGYFRLVGAVRATDAASAIDAVNATSYNGQGVWATMNQREVAGLTAAARAWGIDQESGVAE